VKKFNIILLALAVCAMLAAPALAQFQSGADADGWSPWRLDSYAKDFVMTVEASAADSSTGLLVHSDRAYLFTVPEAAEVVRAWILASDSCITDTVTNYFKSEIWKDTVSTDTSTTSQYSTTILYDTVAFWTPVAKAIATRLTHPGKYAMTLCASVTKRQFAKGRVGKVWVSHAGTNTESPTGIRIQMLFRPKSKPSSADYYYRQ
jgi:hypothetical protein